ncbi:glycosyltransferase [Actinospongicola halichondriae]|uniref:glycosyltransferase n=1 Tax=Actinospongicola halichondriae TaxID=3236844 RepID=UPI003D5390FE
MRSITIVIPCLNAQKVLPTQLAALAPQTAGVEVIVVDNGSSDSTAEIARAAGVRCVEAHDRPGRHHACNVGAASAGGDGLVFIDSDDEVVPGFVEAMSEALLANDFVAGRLDPWSGAEGDAVTQSAGLIRFPWRPFVSGAAMGVSKQAFFEVGGFSEDMSFSEDVDLSWRLMDAGYEPVYAAGAGVRYRTRSTPMDMFRQHRNYGRGQVRLYRRWREHGMPRRGWREARSELSTIIRAVPFLRDRDVRARWARRTGRLVGHLEQSVRSRVLYV